MIKLYYIKTKQGSYNNGEMFLSKKQELLSLMLYSIHGYTEFVFIVKGDDTVEIWDTMLEEEYFNEEEIPKLIMSRKNYDEVINAWNANVDMPKQYLVLSQDDTGWIHLEAKDELSELDLISIEQDQKAGQEWEAEWKQRVNEHKVKQLLRYWHYELRCLAIKVYKKMREFFEDLFLI